MKKRNTKNGLPERYGGKSLQIVQIAHVAARMAKDAARIEREKGNKFEADVLAGVAEDCKGIEKRLSSYTPERIGQVLQFAEKRVGSHLLKEWQRLCPTALKEMRGANGTWDI